MRNTPAVRYLMARHRRTIPVDQRREDLDAPNKARCNGHIDLSSCPKHEAGRYSARDAKHKAEGVDA